MSVVAALAGSILDMTRMRDRCHDVGIEAEVGCPPGAAGKG
jgi:hypothetical protein|nr:hypothetical protein [Kofleriaceae bacterium]